MMNKTTTGPADLHRVIAEAFGGVLQRDLGDIGPELQPEELLGMELDADELEMGHFATVGNLAGFLELALGERE
jgi:hypothetical protein